jgi:D-alanyl-D-alanine carboxypeptidase (penicillin-binding protein 5/6)
MKKLALYGLAIISIFSFDHFLLEVPAQSDARPAVIQENDVPDVAPSISRAYLIDMTHDKVLLSRNGSASIPPASMSKIFTHLMLFERLASGQIATDDTWTVSEKAWRMNGSRSFLEVGSAPRIIDLMLGLAVHSGNDSALAIAEGLHGTEEAFARAANLRIRELGILDTTIVNASGLPHPEHRTTVRDLAMTARHIIENHPEYYGIFGQKEFTWNNISQNNRNPLLGFDGVDGMKTGWTNEAAYGLVASAERQGRRLVAVVAGAESPAVRERSMRELLAWGFDSFSVTDPCQGLIFDLKVSGSRVTSLQAVPARGCPMLIRRGSESSVSLQTVTRDETPAPVSEGDIVGVLLVGKSDAERANGDGSSRYAADPGGGMAAIDLVATRSIERLGMIERIRAGIPFLRDF